MSISYPNQSRNFCLFSNNVYTRIEKGENELPNIKQELIKPKNEEQIIEDLYILNVMLDNGTEKQKIADLYPYLSKYNDSDSPNIQTFLAGIYRKTKIPDAFGPLVKMLIQASVKPQKNNENFDPTEEIGGAILDYLA